MFSIYLDVKGETNVDGQQTYVDNLIVDFDVIELWPQGVYFREVF